jgi:hypothetical protein
MQEILNIYKPEQHQSSNEYIAQGNHSWIIVHPFYEQMIKYCELGISLDRIILDEQTARMRDMLQAAMRADNQLRPGRNGNQIKVETNQRFLVMIDQKYIDASAMSLTDKAVEFFDWFLPELVTANFDNGLPRVQFIPTEDSHGYPTKPRFLDGRIEFHSEDYTNALEQLYSYLNSLGIKQIHLLGGYFDIYSDKNGIYTGGCAGLPYRVLNRLSMDVIPTNGLIIRTGSALFGGVIDLRLQETKRGKYRLNTFQAY